MMELIDMNKVLAVTASITSFTSKYHEDSEYISLTQKTIRIIWLSLLIFRRKVSHSQFDRVKVFSIDKRFSKPLINYCKMSYIIELNNMERNIKRDNIYEVKAAVRNIHKIATSLIVYKKLTTKRRYWIAPLLRLHSECGEYNRLIQQLRKQDHENHFVYFRMTPERFDYLLEKVSDRLRKQNTKFRRAIEPSEQLAMTLRYLAHGDSHRMLALEYLVGHSTACMIIHQVCKALWEVLSPVYLKAPTTEEWEEISDAFYTHCDFPHCVGAIDGKHVQIEKPSNAGSKFFNYKKYHSVVLMAACDSSYRFTLVDIGAPGRCSDGGVFVKSEFGKRLLQENLDLPSPCALPHSNVTTPYCFVGDEAFPLLRNLLRPFPGDSLPIERAVFNYRLSRARRTIENTFGILASRWRIFRKPIKASVQKIVSIIQASVCLHNFLRTLDMEETNKLLYCPGDYVDQVTPNGLIVPGQWRNETNGNTGMISLQHQGQRNSKNTAKDVRELFVTYCNSDEGKLPWQYEVVTRGSTT